jgi:DNA ligase (NAD+)
MTFKTHQEELEFLEKMGFPINPFNSLAKNIQEVWEISRKLDQDKQNLTYPIDGLVIKLNDNQLKENLGVVGKTPRGWCAIKFKAEEVTTKLLDVSWNVGRTGKITPVADLEPVELAGTTVKRATLHNYKDFSEKALQHGDMLIIRKAGEIIPEVLQVLYNLRTKQTEPEKLFKSPSNCPSCGAEVTYSNTGVDLICPNSQNCPAQIINRLVYFTQRNIGNITGLSEKLLEKFIEKFGVRDIPDLYNLPYEEIQELEGFGQKSVENLVKSVENAKTIPDYKFLAGLGLDGIGPEVAKLICEKLTEEETTQV